MDKRILGRTGLQVSRLGAGLAEIGFELTLADVSQAAQVLNTALDGGINFLDGSRTRCPSRRRLWRSCTAVLSSWDSSGNRNPRAQWATFVRLALINGERSG
jgi:hypothetical protein